MVTKVGGIVIDIDARLAKLEASLAKGRSDFKRFERDVKTVGGQVEKNIASISSSFKAIATGAAAAGLVSMAKRALDYASSLGEVSQQLTNGVRGTLAASQICAGDDNRLEVSVYGESGGIHWAQERPDRLILNVAGQPKRHITCDAALVGEPARSMLRLPAGHPEGYLEAFANLYLEFVGRISGGKSWAGLSHHDGLRSMAFIKAVIQSGAGNGRWRTIQA